MPVPSAAALLAMWGQQLMGAAVGCSEGQWSFLHLLSMEWASGPVCVTSISFFIYLSIMPFSLHLSLRTPGPH